MSLLHIPRTGEIVVPGRRIKPPLWAPGINLSHPLAQGLMCYVAANEGGGNRASEYGMVGDPYSLLNGASFNVGKYGPQIYCAGTAQQIEGGSNLPFSTDAVTMAILFRYVSHEQWAAVLAKATPTGRQGASSQFGLAWYSSTHDITIVRNGDGGTTSAFTLTTGGWYFLIATATSTASNLWVNGALEYTGGGRGSGVTGNDTAKLVRWMALDEDWVTRGDFVFGGVWDKEFTPGEVALLYQDPFAIIRPPSSLPLIVAATSGAAAGAETIIAATLTAEATLVGPTLAAGAVAIAQDALTAEAALVSPTLTPGAVSIAQATLEATADLIEPTLTPGATSLAIGTLAGEAELGTIGISESVAGPIVSVIKSSGGDYTNLADWAADLVDDPPANGGYTASIEEAMDVGPVTIDVSNANGAPILITVAEGYRFSDQAGWPNCADVEGVGARLIGGVLLKSPNTTIEWLELTKSAGHTIDTNTGSPDGSVIRFCLFTAADRTFFRSTFAAASNWTVSIENCFGYNWDTGSYGSACMQANRAEGTINVRNCTFLNTNASALGLEDGNGVLNAYNCIVLGSTTADYSNVAAGDYNMSSDTTAVGTNTWKSVTPADILENLTSGSEDLHLKSANDGSYEGDDLSATIGSIDIDDGTRVDWDIGADELVSTAAAITFDPLEAVGALIAPSLAPGAVEVTPASLEAEATILAPTVDPGAAQIAPAALEAQGTLLSPTLSPGAVSMALTTLAAESALAAPVLLPGGVSTVAGALAAIGELPGVTVTYGTAPIAPDLLEAVAALTAPSLIPGAVEISPAVLQAIAALVSPTVAPAASTIAPSPLAALATIPGISILAGLAQIQPAALNGIGEIITPSIAPGAVALELAVLDAVGTAINPAISAAGSGISPVTLEGVGTLRDLTVLVGSVSMQIDVIEGLAEIIGPVMFQGVVLSLDALEGLGSLPTPFLYIPIGANWAVLVDFDSSARAVGRIIVYPEILVARPLTEIRRATTAVEVLS